jgi:hypothetical protein
MRWSRVRIPPGSPLFTSFRLSGLSHELAQSVFHVGWGESVGAGGAFEGDFTVAINYVEAVGPSGVGGFDAIAQIVDYGWDVDSQFAYTAFSHGGSFLKCSRIGEDDLFADVDRHLPGVAGVRFADVDDQELGAILVLRVKIVERGNLPAKGWSSVAAEHEDDGALPPE